MKQILDFLEKQRFVSDFIKEFKQDITSVRINSNMDVIELYAQENIPDTADKEHYRTYLNHLIDDPLISSKVEVDHRVICLRNRDTYVGQLKVDVFTGIDDMDIMQIYLMLAIPEELADTIRNQPDILRSYNLFTSSPYKEKVEEVQTAINKLSHIEAKHRLSLCFADKKTINPWIEAGWTQHAILDLQKIIDVFENTSFKYMDTFPAFRSKRIFLFKSDTVLLKVIQARRANQVQVELSVEAGAVSEEG